MFDNGFLGMSWPKEYGGQGATQIEVAIFNEEMARFRAPTPLNFMGLTMAGPTLIVHGTEEQKKRFIGENPYRRRTVVPGILGARRRLGPGGVAHPRRTQGR